MKQPIQRGPAFIIRSVLWSLLFYGILMLVLNREEVTAMITGKDAVTIVDNNMPDAPANTVIAPQTGTHINFTASARNIFMLMQAMNGR